MGLSPELWVVAVIALVVLAVFAGRSYAAWRRGLGREPAVTLSLVAPLGWAGDWDRLKLLMLASQARARLRPGMRLRLSLRSASKPNLVLERSSEGMARLILSANGWTSIPRPDLLPAIEGVPLSPRAGASRLAVLLALHRQALGAAPLARRALLSLRDQPGQSDADRYLTARLDALDAAVRQDARRLRSALERLLALDGGSGIDCGVLALNCGSFALDLSRLGDRAGLSRVMALLEREAARPDLDAGRKPVLELLRGRLLGLEAERAEDASLREAALRLLGGARMQAGPGSRPALAAGLAEIDCLLVEAEQSNASRSATSKALALIAALGKETSNARSDDRARLTLAKGRALFLQGVGRGDLGVIEQALAALTPPPAGPLSPELRSELAEWRGRVGTELALRRADPQQARIAIADLENAHAAAAPARRTRLHLAVGHAHGWLYETTRGEGHYQAAARAYKRALSEADPGALPTSERHRGALAASRLHLLADDMAPGPEHAREAVAAWETARASLPAGAGSLALVEMHRIGGLALRKLSRLSEGAERVAALDRAVRSIEAALEGLTATSAASALRVGLLRVRGEMLAELASLGAGPIALEKSISSYRHALADAEGVARADALEGLAQVLTDLAAARGETPPAAAHDALEEAYGLLVANGAPTRADAVLSNSRRLGPRPANDPL